MGAAILVVEDQPAMLLNIQLRMEASGYKVVTAVDGVEALAALDTHPIDLILADIAMPRMNGYQLYEQVRQEARWALIPFIFISARVLDSDVRYGKALGVDDYLTKPFQLEDLLAVVAGRLRRGAELKQAFAAAPASGAPPSAAEPCSQDLVKAGALTISPSQHRVWMDGRPVEVSPHEFAILAYLAGQPGRAVPLTELCRATHGLDTDPADAGALLYPVIRSLRRRLGYKAGESGCIESVRGIGYRLAIST
jgi:DNA-binding response OmpR family regulator